MLSSGISRNKSMQSRRKTTAFSFELKCEWILSESNIVHLPTTLRKTLHKANRNRTRPSNLRRKDVFEVKVATQSIPDNPASKTAPRRYSFIHSSNPQLHLPRWGRALAFVFAAFGIAY